MRSRSHRSPGVGHDEPVRVGIVGGAGYAGAELIRLLLRHPRVQIAWVHSRSHPGQPVSVQYPSLAGLCSLAYVDGALEELARDADVVFFATSPGQSASAAATLLEAGRVVIDLSADFRLKEPSQYERVYGWSHPHPALLGEAAYGVPELFAEEIRRARLVANPGCYPTAVLLALAPLVRAGWIDLTRPTVVAATSGISGAGSQPAPAYHFPVAAENVRPYGLPRHRHVPEMEQALAWLAGSPAPSVRVVFVPHLVPASRGILATCVAPVTRSASDDELAALYRDFYRGAPFVRVQAPPRLPETKAVYGSNFCDVAARADPTSGCVVAMAAIDNLVKGASGQAVQNLNLLMGWDETLGLDVAPVYP